MKRNINLQELSKDHHHGLLLSWKIRQGLKLDAERSIMNDYVQYFYREALSSHFLEEESLLLAHLEDSNELKKQTIREHQDIAKLVNQLDATQEDSNFISLADLIEAHIRFEERVLFP